MKGVTGGRSHGAKSRRARSRGAVSTSGRRLRALGLVLALASAGAGACADSLPPMTPGGGAGGASATGGAGGTGGMDGGGAAGMGSAGGASETGGAIGGGGRAACESRTQFTMATHEILTVTWPAGAATLEGNGQVHLWGKILFTANGGTLTGSIQACGTDLPATDLNPGIGGGKVAIEVPGAAWDAPTVSRFQIDATQTGWGVGSTVTYGYTALVGFTEAAASWPASYVDIKTTNDFDGDLKPGVTGAPRTGTGYQLPPASALAAVGSGGRADRLYLVDRNSGSVTLTRTSCDEASGTETSVHFDNHVVGCHISGGGECTPAEVKFIDDNRTIYSVTGATAQATTVRDDATCADVRRALPMLP